ncbi:polysaccharide pyruvyl transferase family protein [Cellulomonas sp.]|uniref:polysaccharide pyruvyl transferase family protein n=1 Tax=Cellulomonas sp. TaxID=40001 RepID=UPI003BAD44E1
MNDQPVAGDGGQANHPTGSVATLGAYDRFNYGDLLFPLVLDDAAARLRLRPLSHFSVRAADMSNFAGFTCHSLASKEFAGATGVLVGGGEVLGARWGQALISQTPAPFDKALLALNKISARGLDLYSMWRLGGSDLSPFIPTVGPDRRLATNAIGASSIAMLPPRYRAHVIEVLASAAYLSVRDSAGLELLRGEGLRPTLAPDSASVLARLYPVPRVDNGTLVVQCSWSWLRRNLSPFLQFVREASSQYTQIALLPIGLAGGHGDSEALRRVQSAVRRENVQVVQVRHIWDIAEAIAQSAAFVGSSLHGHVTAMAYGVPSVALAGISKLTAYVETWGDDAIPVVAPLDLSAAVVRARSANFAFLLERADRLADLADVSTRRALASLAEQQS